MNVRPRYVVMLFIDLVKLIIYLVKFFIRHPNLGGLLGLGVALLCGLGGVLVGSDLVNMPGQPEIISLAEAGAKDEGRRLWVVLNDGRWDCNSLAHYKDGQWDETAIAVTDDSRKTVVVAYYSGVKSCADLTQNLPTGRLWPLGPATLAVWNERLDLMQYNADHYFLLCGYCDPSNSVLSFQITCGASLLGLMAYPVLLFLNRLRNRSVAKSPPAGEISLRPVGIIPSQPGIVASSRSPDDKQPAKVDNLAAIASSLKRIQTEGGYWNIVTFTDPVRGYYVQFAGKIGADKVLAEAVSNVVLEPRLRLNEKQIAQMTAMGWEPPEAGERNFCREFRASTNSDRQGIAFAVRRVFVEVYGVDFKRPLDVDCVLE